MAEVEVLCSRLTIVHQGEVVFAGTVDDLRKQAPAAVHRLHTSDDPGALAVGAQSHEVQVTVAADGASLEVAATEAALDAYVIALGRAGIAVRRLESRDRSLEAMFLRLTTADATPSNPARRAAPPAAPAAASRERSRVSPGGLLVVMGVEYAKLRAQLKVWAVLAVCLLGPPAFAVAMRVQSEVPEDTLFGRWAKASGLAVPLVVLGFAGLWAFPALTSIVGGDLFSAEDRHGTWPALLTRSRTRGEIFGGKVLTGLSFSMVVVFALAISSVAAGTLLLSAATRSAAAGIGLPVLVGGVMQLSAYVNLPRAVDRALLTPPLVAWHGLFAEPPYYGPLTQGMVTSSVYFAGGLAATYVLLRRRDMGA
jgi:ABC-2 type transport system permease protein